MTEVGIRSPTKSSSLGRSSHKVTEVGIRSPTKSSSLGRSCHKVTEVGIITVLSAFYKERRSDFIRKDNRSPHPPAPLPKEGVSHGWGLVADMVSSNEVRGVVSASPHTKSDPHTEP